MIFVPINNVIRCGHYSRVATITGVTFNQVYTVFQYINAVTTLLLFTSLQIIENLREKGLDTPAMRYEAILHEILTEV